MSLDEEPRTIAPRTIEPGTELPDGVEVVSIRKRDLDILVRRVNENQETIRDLRARIVLDDRIVHVLQRKAGRVGKVALDLLEAVSVGRAKSRVDKLASRLVRVLSDEGFEEEKSGAVTSVLPEVVRAEDGKIGIKVKENES